MVEVEILKRYKDMQLGRLVEATEKLVVSDERGKELSELGIAKVVAVQEKVEEKEVDLTPPLKEPEELEKPVVSKKEKTEKKTTRRKTSKRRYKVNKSFADKKDEK